MSRRRSWSDLRADMEGSTARAVGTLYRRFVAATNQAYATRGWKGFTLSHVQFLTETDEQGTRLSDVAAALGTTKQYVGKLAKDLESKRLVHLAADPIDGRAIRVRPTERGRSFMQAACAIRAELEAEFLGVLPRARAAAFVEAVKQIVNAKDG